MSERISIEQLEAIIAHIDERIRVLQQDRESLQKDADELKAKPVGDTSR